MLQNYCSNRAISIIVMQDNQQKPDTELMDRAVELALQNVRHGGKPFGAVLVKEGKVIATGVNEVVQRGDVTAHAELEAIRKATSEGYTLEGATLYASGHPCPMCLSASYLAGIAQIFYQAGLEEEKEAGLDVSHIYAELRKSWQEQQLPLQRLSSALSEDPLKEWMKRQGRD